MEIFIEDIPNEGLHQEGELPATIFDLDPDDTIRVTGPVTYSVDIFAMEEVVAFAGSLAGSFELQCGTCLEFFPYQADYPNWSSELDIEERQKSFELKVPIREDILIALPSHPRCDEFVENHTCPKAHLFENEEDEKPDEPEDDGRNVWSALDQIS